MARETVDRTFSLAEAKKDAIDLVDELIYAVDYTAEPTDELQAIYRLIREARERLNKATA